MAGKEYYISDGLDDKVDAFDRGLEGYNPFNEELRLAAGGIASQTTQSRPKLGAELRGDLLDCYGYREDVTWVPEVNQQHQ